MTAHTWFALASEAGHQLMLTEKVREVAGRLVVTPEPAEVSS